MADFPRYLRDAELEAGLAAAFDREGKILRAVDSLGPVSVKRVLLLDGGEKRAAQLDQLGADVRRVDDKGLSVVPDRAGEVLVSFWTAFRPGLGDADGQVREAERVVVPGGRLLVVHDYGRDDVSRFIGDEQRDRTLIEWSDRRGWFLTRGFKVRVIHCWWTFESIEQARELLGRAFGPTGAELAEALTRPRLSYKVAVYHRSIGEARG